MMMRCRFSRTGGGGCGTAATIGVNGAAAAAGGSTDAIVGQIGQGHFIPCVCSSNIGRQR